VIAIKKLQITLTDSGIHPSEMSQIMTSSPHVLANLDELAIIDEAKYNDNITPLIDFLKICKDIKKLSVKSINEAIFRSIS
jgi:hypothetical protein